MLSQKRRTVRSDGTARLLPQIAAIVPDYRQYRAQLDEDLKRAAYATLEVEKVGKDDQMASGRNRQKLGDPFDNAEYDHSPKLSQVDGHAGSLI